MQIGRPPITPLDSLQQAAAEAPAGPVLVLGGPGTGKTRALLARVAVLLERGESPSSITCLSCSSQGAEDLRRRVAQCPETSVSSSAMFIGTFHRCVLQVLRTWGGAILGMPTHFVVHNRVQAVETLSGLLSANPDLDIPPRQARRVLQWYWVNQNRWQFEHVPPEAASWPEAIRLYRQENGRRGVVDVDELVPLAVWAMEHVEAFADCWRSMGTRHLLIDDFQEITEAQYRLLTLITGTAPSITAAANPNGGVGLQLGSNPRLLERVRLDWSEVNDPHKNPRDRRTHLLKINHRATKMLSQMADRVVSHQTMTGLHQESQTSLRVAGTAPILRRFEGRPEDMYLHVLQSAQRMVDDGSDWGDMACIYRNHQTFERMRTLVLAEGIPYTVLGGDRWEWGGEAGGVIAMLNLLLNPKDTVSFSAAAATDLRPERNRLDSEVVHQLCRTAQEQGTSLVEAAEAAEAGMADYKDGSRTHRDMRYAASAWRELTAMLENPEISLADLCQRAMVLLRAAGPSRSNRDVEPGMIRLLAMARSLPLHEDDTPRDSLSRLLDALNADPDHDPLELERNDPLSSNRALTFSTIATSSGRQWHTVFVLDASDGVMPGRVSPDDGERWHMEQRLFYVASTRASDRLVYCYAVRSGPNQGAMPSRFLGTIGDDLLQMETIPGPGPA